MNKILALLMVLVVIYQSFSPLVNLFTRKKAGRKEYKLTFSKQFNHLFSATLLLLIPLVILNNYYQYFYEFPLSVKIGLTGLAILCGIGASISIYLYKRYKRKTPYNSFIYDPNLYTFEFANLTGKSSIRLNNIRRVEWYSIKNSLKMLPWSNFEYFILEMNSGNKILITSLMIPPIQLRSILSDFEIQPFKKIIPSIK